MMRSLKFLLVSCALVGDFALLAVSSQGSEIQSLTLEAQQAYAAKNYDLSEQKYRKALTLAVSAPPATQIVLLSNLGACCREAHKFPEAEEAFKRAIALAKKSGLIQAQVSRLAMQHYAALLRRMKRNSEADAMELGAVEPSLAHHPLATPLSQPNFHHQASTSPVLPEPTNPSDEPEIRSISADKVTPEQLQDHLQRNPDDYVAWRLLAYKHGKAEQWSKAADDYKTIVRRFRDKEKEGRSALAWAFYKSGQNQEAIEECKRLLELDPEDPLTYRILSSSYSRLGDMRSKLEVDETYVEKFPGHEDHSAVSDALPHLRRDVANLSGKPDAVARPTQNEETKCWARHKMPIKVYIHEREDDSIKLDSSGTGITDNTPGEIIQRAMDSWVQASEGRISFELSPRQEDANICCFFTKDPDGLENDCAAGLTSWNMQSSHPQVKISLLAVNRHDAKPIDRNQFYDTCLHEFGHALGLEHSSSTADIMYRAVHAAPLGALSETDKARIVTLYKLGH